MRIKLLLLAPVLMGLALLSPAAIPAQDVDRLPPQIDSDAQIVVWADVHRFGLSELLSWARQTELGPLLEVPGPAENTVQWKQAVELLEKLRAAGAKRVYLIVDSQILLGNISGLGMVIQCDQPERCAAALAANPLVPGQSLQATQDAVLLTMSPEGMEAFAEVGAAPSANLQKALESRQDAVGIALAMPAEYRRLIQSAPYGEGLEAKVIRSAVNLEWVRIAGTPPDSKLRANAVFGKPEQAAEFVENFNSFSGSLAGKGEKLELLLAVEDRVTLSQQSAQPLEEMAKVARASAQRAANMNTLRQLVLAMHNFHDATGALPPQALTDQAGKRLLSWRVLLLPYLQEQELYNQFHLDEAWDSPHNLALLEKMPVPYRSAGEQQAGDVKPGYTRFVAPLTANSIMGKPGDRCRLQDIADGTSNTILLLQAAPAAAVPWTKPDDLVVEEANPLAGMITEKQMNLLTGFADGSVRALPASLDPQTLKALLSENGGEVIPPDKLNH